jgi:DNA-binding XRE family transcriptional regulator
MEPTELRALNWQAQVGLRRVTSVASTAGCDALPAAEQSACQAVRGCAEGCRKVVCYLVFSTCDRRASPLRRRLLEYRAMHTTDGRRAPRRHTIPHERGPLGTRLQTARLTRGLTQAQLATCSGVPVSTIGRLECGRIHAPSFAVVVALAQALAITPSWLLSSDPDVPGGP